MYTRVVPKEDLPKREDIDLAVQLCPPHDFEAAWATPTDAANHEDTVPGLYCKACGDVRPFKIP